MSYDVCRYIFYGGAALSAIMLVVSVILFIKLNIPKIISDLSGNTARKAIRQIREQNEASGGKNYRPSPYNEARGKLTDKISPSGNLVKQHVSTQLRGVDTTKIGTQQLPIHEEPAGETSVLEAPAETSVLEAPAETFVPEAPNETTVLTPEPGHTASLAPQTANETTVLTADLNATVSLSAFAIEYEITFVHTAEVIEGGVTV